MQRHPKISISSTILIYMACVSVVAVISVGALWGHFERRDFRAEVQFMEDAYISSQKQALKREVDDAMAFARYMRSMTEKRLKEDIQRRVNEAHAIATNLYRQYHHSRSKAEIGQMVKDALRPIRFKSGRGYYFAFTMQGVETLFAANPSMEGKDMRSVVGGNGELVVADMLELVHRQDEGFYRYTWPKPGQKGFFPKIAFVKRFDPLNWVIGTGEYLDDVERDIQKEVLQWIATIQFGKDGYVFAGQWDGVSLSGPATGKNMLGVTDVNGVKIVKELIQAARSGGGYVHYTLPKFEGRRKAPKLSYVVALDEWQWYIGAGVYIDEIQSVVQRKQAELNQRIRRQLIYAACLLAGVLAIVLLCVRLLARRINTNLVSFTTFFGRASDEQIVIDPQVFHFSDFHDLAVSANRMIEKRNAAEKALEENRTWLRTLLDSIQSGVIVIDATDHRIIDVNQTSLNLINAEREQVVGRQCWKFLCPSEIGACPITDLGEALNQSERILLTTDGQEVPVLKTCNAFTIDGRRFIIESFLDLTEQKKLQEQLRQAHKLEALGLLAGGVSHDLNNMLSPIIGFSEIILMDVPHDDPRKDYLEQIHSAGIKAKELVHQLLAFGRKQALEITSVDINRLIGQLERLLKRTIPENIGINIRLDASNPLVKADANQIEQVCLNLMLNARDAMPDGGDLTIETRVVEIGDEAETARVQLAPGSYVELTIVDTGVGIEPGLLEKIFDPFFTTKEKGKGTGLGLAMAYGIVKQHNGGIKVDSMPRRGTCFTIFLPVSRLAVTENHDPARIHPEALRGTETIMVVEDNDSVRGLAGDILKQFGYTILSASQASACLDILSSHAGELDLVLTDVVMPDMDGKELYETIRSRHKDVRVLFMSGYTDQIIARHGVIEQGLHFIQKPFSVEALAIKVRQVLDAADV